MGVQTMNTVAARIGKTKGDILKAAISAEVLTKGGLQKKLAKNSSDTVVYRRVLPPSGIDNQWINAGNVDTFADNYKLVEGVTPSSRTLNYVDVTAVVEQYGVLYAMSDKAFDLYEDDIAGDQRMQIGESITMIRELIAFGALKASTNKYFAGGSDTSTVSKSLSIPLLRRVARNLYLKKGVKTTKILDSSGGFGTSSVEASYLVYCSSDLSPAIRDLPGFVNIADYGSRRLVSEQEIGTVEDFRFILSPELAPKINAGVVVGVTGLQATGPNVDVYSVIVAAEEGWGTVMLRGADSITPTWVPSTPSAADPLGQRSYYGAKFYADSLILNQGWIAVVECGAPNLLE